MEVFGIIALVIALGILGYTVFYIVNYLKKHKVKKNESFSVEWKTYKFLIMLVVLNGLGAVLGTYGVALINNAHLVFKDHLFIILCGLVFGVSLAILVITFILNLFRPTQVEKERKWIRLALFISIPMTILFFFLTSEGVASYLRYPLYNAIDFTYGLTSFMDPSGGFRIAFYGLLIVGGAFISYAVCDHYFAKKYGKHGLIDTLFLVAFPMGLVGARLWYCFVLEPDYFLANPLEIITGITKGGLAIQGGAMLGAISGIIFMLIFRRYVDIRFAIDVCVPTILIAQAIGRWGNFFNAEVHGLASSIENFRFLPSVIINQMQYSSANGAVSLVGTDQMYVPLFLIESAMNMGGYFVIRYAFGPIRKHLPLLFQGSMYFVWYGLTRIILEPLRFGYVNDTSAADGGFGYSQSLVTAIVMVSIGVVLIGVSFLWAFLEKKHGKKHEFPNFNLD